MKQGEREMESHTGKKRTDRLAELLDSKFRIPQTDIQFGIDPILGLVPGAGDWIGGAVSIYFLLSAVMLGGSTSVLVRMFFNILIDILIGSIPVLGDFFDIYWKANIRNAEIIQNLRENPQETTVASRLWIWLLLIQFIAILLALLLFVGWLIVKLFALLF